MSEKEKIPEDKIVLLDLNYTLVANSRSCHGAYPKRIYQQVYEKDLIDAIKDNYVILITARPGAYKDETLEHIKELTGFVPDESYWNVGVGKMGLPPHKLKEKHLLESIFVEHGNDASKYIAVESNPMTRKMYESYGIYAKAKNNFI